MNGTTNPVKQFSAVLDLILNQIRATRPGEPETLKAPFQVRWLPYLDAAYPIEAKELGDGLYTAHNRRDTLAGLDSSWERDIMAESLMAAVLHEDAFQSGIYLVKTSPFQKTAAMLTRLGVVTSRPVRDRMHTFTFVKAITIGNYLEAQVYADLKSRGMVETVIYEAFKAPGDMWGVRDAETHSHVLHGCNYEQAAASWLAAWHTSNPGEDWKAGRAAYVATFNISTDQSAEFIGTPPPNTLITSIGSPDIPAGHIFMLNTQTGETEHCDPLRWDGYPIYVWREISRAEYDLINAQPLEAIKIIAGINERDKMRGVNKPDFPGYANLPPARPVAVSASDLALAVRRMFEVSGRVDQQRLYRFILEVMAGEQPDTSPDPKPLIQGLDVIASGMTGDFTPDYIAQQALYAYNNRQTLTVATGVQNHD